MRKIEGREYMMSVEKNSLETRFDKLFNDEGLTNVKFFVRKSQTTSESKISVEICALQDAIAAGKFAVVKTIDGTRQKVRHDAPYR